MSSFGPPGVEDRDTKPFKISNIARHHRQAMLQRSRCDLAVGHIEWTACELPLAFQNAPSFGDESRQRKNAISKSKQGPAPQSIFPTEFGGRSAAEQ